MGVNAIQEMGIDRTADSIARIKDLEEQITTKDRCIGEETKKIDSLNRELSKTRDDLAEKETYIKNVDNMYAETIDTKTKN